MLNGDSLGHSSRIQHDSTRAITITHTLFNYFSLCVLRYHMVAIATYGYVNSIKIFKKSKIQCSIPQVAGGYHIAPHRYILFFHNHRKFHLKALAWNIPARCGLGTVAQVSPRSLLKIPTQVLPQTFLIMPRISKKNHR